MAASNDRMRITLIAGDDDGSSLRPKGREQVAEVDIVVRSPNGEGEEDLAAAARLCSCRRVCVVLLEPV